jgi:fatty-acyl-CoA synthase
MVVKRHSVAKTWLRALEMTSPIVTKPTRILPVAIAEVAERQAEAPALISREESFTYRALVERSNQYARWAIANGVAKGDVVCLLMPNRPEYMAIWLGITLVGGVVSLLNTNLTGDLLAHCINAVEPKHVIVEIKLVQAIESALPAVRCRPPIWVHGGRVGDFMPIEASINLCSGEMLRIEERRPVTINDRALLIYTSGTTGLPKAANISHYRLVLWSYWFAGMMDVANSDRMYDCLPMYHAVGGVVATGALLVSGGSVMIREQFSASNFWNDIVEWNCTTFQYIGELCRYLLNSPRQVSETHHQLRLCCGNGLRADVWEPFKTRFRIPQIIEFYASTESALSLYNVEGKPGAIGRIPPYLAHRFPMALVRTDVGTGMAIRDANGFCVRCAADEIGEALARIDDGSRDSCFDGYTSAEESAGKILHDVFRSGDVWFRTGDLMRRDKNGYVYFVDRIGDSFRWKGENVSTAEVSDVISAYPGVIDATVYGVVIPHADGKAGMVALVTDHNFDLARFCQFLIARLPHYARPLFVRITDSLETTATLKHKNRFLAKAGYDTTINADKIYFFHTEQQAFVSLDKSLSAQIREGKIRL